MTTYLFEQNPVWQKQLAYYQNLGVFAWSGRVPFFITNTWRFAKLNCDAILSYLSDMQQLDNKPWCILELGSGIGQCTVRILHLLDRALDTWKNPPSITFIACDASQQIIRYLKTHSQITPR
mgnify:CR=1 FL=1|tara:strand:- start:626 stop:991 length:366 start_codon:yes stop_codon:yes gene_type:complete